MDLDGDGFDPLSARVFDKSNMHTDIKFNEQTSSFKESSSQVSASNMAQIDGRNYAIDKEAFDLKKKQVKMRTFRQHQSKGKKNKNQLNYDEIVFSNLQT